MRHSIDHKVETSKPHLETTNAYPSGLAQWLADNAITRNQLATELGVSPHTIGHLANGSTGTASKAILRAVAERTGLTYEQILDPVDNYISPVATGDHRVDRCIAKLGQHLYTPEMYEACRLYIHPKFRCSGSAYIINDMEPVDYETMCDINLRHTIVGKVQISHTVLLTTWYTPLGIDSRDSKILHTYWRGLILVDGEPPSYNDTFVVYEFEKSLNEMTPLDIPQIISWWWDQPSPYGRLPIESNPLDTMAVVADRRKNKGGEASVIYRQVG